MVGYLQKKVRLTGQTLKTSNENPAGIISQEISGAPFTNMV